MPVKIPEVLYGGPRMEELVTFLFANGFTIPDQCHIVPGPLPKNYPHQRPEDLSPNPNRLRGLPNPLPIAYLDTIGIYEGPLKLYAANEDIPELKPHRDKLKTLLSKF
jgi:hypothetical protein